MLTPLSGRIGFETFTGHVVKRIGHADPNPPAERLDRLKLTTFDAICFDL